MLPFTKAQNASAAPASSASAGNLDAGAADYIGGCGRGCIIGNSPGWLTVVVIPVRCRSWRCPDCAPVKLLAWRRRILAGRPTRLLTLTIETGSGHTPQEATDLAKHAWPRLVAMIRRAFGAFEYVAAWQLTKKGFPHLHVVTRGCYIPQKWLSARWGALTRSPIVDIRQIKNAAVAANYVSRYMLRDAASAAETLTDRRIITASRAWDSEAPPPAADPRWQGWQWGWNKDEPAEIAAWYQRRGYHIDPAGAELGLWLFTQEPTDPPLEHFAPS